MSNSFVTNSYSTCGQSQKINVNYKILGLNPQFDMNTHKLVPLPQILPISINQLNFILANLVSILLEISKRNLKRPNIEIKKIMMLENNYTCGIPFIFTHEDKKLARECQDLLVREFQFLCKQLGYDQNLINCDSLNEFQDKLLLKINFQQDSLKENSSTLLHYFNCGDSKRSFYNENTELYVSKTPQFIMNSQNDDHIAIKISQSNQEIYDLREIEIIEDFNNQHLPYLYGYIRYSDILFLFLKKHDKTFSQISLEIYKKRKDFEKNKELIEQIFLRFFQQMIKAIKYIHSIGIIHRDIKPDNIMFDFSQTIQNYIEIFNISINCVFIDFDRSINENYDPNIKSHYKGTPFFRPPEGEQNTYFQSYDIWQLGFMFFVLSKDFYYQKKGDYAKILQMSVEIQQYNQEIEKLNESQDMYFIDRLIEQREKKYNELIEKIDKSENFFTYNNILQKIIKKMIHLNPQQRANIVDVSSVINSLIK